MPDKKQVHQNTLQKWHDIQKSWKYRHGMGLRHSIILKQLAREFYLSESRIQHILCIKLEDYEVRPEKS